MMRPVSYHYKISKRVGLVQNGYNLIELFCSRHYIAANCAHLELDKNQLHLTLRSDIRIVPSGHPFLSLVLHIP